MKGRLHLWAMVAAVGLMTQLSASASGQTPPAEPLMERREPAMQKDERGVWTGTSQPLAPEIYQYNFMVDGARVTDPSNARFMTSYRRVDRSALLAPGDNPWTPMARTPRGALAQHLYNTGVEGLAIANGFVYRGKKWPQLLAGGSESPGSSRRLQLANGGEGSAVGLDVTEQEAGLCPPPADEDIGLSVSIKIALTHAPASPDGNAWNDFQCDVGEMAPPVVLPRPQL